MDLMEEIEVIKLYNRNIKRSQSFLYNVLGKINFEDVFIETHNLGQNVVEKIHEMNQQFWNFVAQLSKCTYWMASWVLSH